MADEKGYATKNWEQTKAAFKRRTPWLQGPPDKSLRRDPLPAFSFLVDIDLGKGKEAQALFQSVSGLQYNTQVVPVGAGGVNDRTYKLVGHTEWPNLVLKKGFTNNSELLIWRRDWMRGEKRRRFDGKITLLDTSLKEKAMWHFTRGWPCKWDISEFSASKNEIAIETLEIAHDGLFYSIAGGEGIYGGGPGTPQATPDVPSPKALDTTSETPQTKDLSGGYDPKARLGA